MAFKLELTCQDNELLLCSNTRLVAEVAKSLQWSPKVQRLADKVVGEILADSKTGFNSVHLRMEKDARDWAKIMGGSAVSFHSPSSSSPWLAAHLLSKNRQE